MIFDLFFAFWFFLPAALANTAPIFVAKIPILSKLSYPVDGYRTFRGKRIFGDHKTIRGLIAGMIVGIAVVVLEKYLYLSIPWLQAFLPLNYQIVNPFILGTLLGLGALTGDTVKSFFKRQLNIASGKSWFPFDQVDFIIGGILFTLPYIQLTLIQYLWILLIWFLMHPISTVVGYLLKLKNTPI